MKGSAGQHQNPEKFALYTKKMGQGFFSLSFSVKLAWSTFRSLHTPENK